MKKVLIYIINLYQQYISLDTGLPKKLGLSRGFVCMHYPTCSEYTKQAIQKYGAIKGSKMGTKRIFRCIPGSEPTIDPLM